VSHRSDRSTQVIRLTGTERSGEVSIHDRLRQDVRLLGDILSAILRAQEGIELFDLVERVRALAIRARSGSSDDAEALRALLAGLAPDQALPLARAFAHFPALTNIAEQHHRVRLRRERAQSAGEASAIADAFARFRAAGVTPDGLHAAVADLHVDITLTAHPTQ